MLELLPAGTPAGARQRVEALLAFEAPLDAAAIARAARVQRRVAGRTSPGLYPRCAPRAMPLDVRFADYTLGENGEVIPGSKGWTRAERTRFSRFLCRMLPIVRELYGEPFQRWTVTLVKDLSYDNSWAFIPSLLEIHTSGDWNPERLTHEILHAFRGQRMLTSDANWQYSPTLTGFEEGFAEGVAYIAMNKYVSLHCADGDCAAFDVPSQTLWYSYLEPTYDFSNDASLTCEDFWSDSGGTLKPSERYQMAAAAVMRLEVAIPGFSRRFNQEYYRRIAADDDYRPSRTGVVAIVQSLSPTIDGVPTHAWISRQHIFDSRTVYGKRDWLVNYYPYSWPGEHRMNALFFMERFPGGSGWYEYVPGCPTVEPGLGPYLYYRLDGTAAEVELVPVQEDPGIDARPVTATSHPSAGRSQGCNDVPGPFAVVEIHRVTEPVVCTSYWWPERTCFEPARPFGLHLLHTRWANPQHGLPPGPPDYAMPYDATQAEIASAFPMLAGEMPPDYDKWRHLLTGAIVGARTGTLHITHSARPGTVTVPVVNGAFYTAIPTCPEFPGDGTCWAHPYAPWDTYQVTVPGTLTFRFEGDEGLRLTEQRTIVYGYLGHHEFLLGWHRRARRR